MVLHCPIIIVLQLLQCNYIKQLIDILEGLLSEPDSKNLDDDHLAKLVIFSAMWSLGAALELDDRQRLERFLRANPDQLLPFPNVRNDSDESIFEFVVGATGNWEHWRERVPDYAYPRDHTPEFTKILVPNVDNTRTDYLVHLVANQGKPVLLIGEQVSQIFAG